MLGKMLGGLINTEQIVHDTIQNTLEKLSHELNCEFNELFIMIKPLDETFTMRFWVYKLENNRGPKLVREIPLSEVLGDE
jgi:hypothetical protein